MSQYRISQPASGWASKTVWTSRAAADRQCIAWNNQVGWNSPNRYVVTEIRAELTAPPIETPSDPRLGRGLGTDAREAALLAAEDAGRCPTCGSRYCTARPGYCTGLRCDGCTQAYRYDELSQPDGEGTGVYCDTCLTESQIANQSPVGHHYF